MEPRFEVTMNEYLPLRDVVFNTLRQAILRGELKPGERLMEIQLANKLGVSRTPIREAIRKLELEGLVLMIPRKGAEVAEITEKNLRDVLEVRCALEELAVQLACDLIDKQGIQDLRKAAKHFESVLYRYRIEYLKKKEGHPQLVAEHEEVIDAIESGEREKAMRITSQHIDNQVETVADTIRHK